MKGWCAKPTAYDSFKVEWLIMKMLPWLMLGLVLIFASCAKSLAEREPTCNDGIQNQDETSIDCGGSCPAVCPTCTDGIRNQGEAGIDCGGPCQAVCASIDCTTCTNAVQGGQSQTFCEDDFVSQSAYDAAVNNAIANGSMCD
jgi:hypothetical protein